MLSKSQINFIKSLHHKKFRKETGLFIIEGFKSIVEFLHSEYTIQGLYYSENLPHGLTLPANITLFKISREELRKLSALQNPQDVLAVVEIPEQRPIPEHSLHGKFSIILDDVQDPGNLGTIIRTADWFGISDIICSLHTVEVYNPKTIQATMGSLSRVNIYYLNLLEFLKENKLPVVGALLEGENIYDQTWGSEGLILLGNEGQGINKEYLPFVSKPITIPRIGKAESLNVGSSAAIFCSELQRSKGKAF